MTDRTQLSQRLEWRGRTVAWDRIGAGPPVVLLHGTPWSSALWRPIADVLATRWTVYLWDMPGYGQSSMAPDHDVDLGVQGELFAALLSAWDLPSPHVVAHDFGGAVALRARLLHGARYASLCLVDAVALSPWGSPFFQLVQEHADVFARLPPAVHRGAIEAYIRSASHRGLRDEELEELVSPWVSAEGQQAFYRQIAQAEERFTDEVEQRYATLTEPVHIIWGSHDTWIPIDRADRLAAAFPRASRATIDGAGHLIHRDAPEALATEVSAWLHGRER